MSKLTCREVIEFLDDYVDGRQPDEVRTRFESHLSHCECCKHYLKTYQETIRLSRCACCDDPDGAPPDDIPEAIIKAIMKLREECDSDSD